MASTSSSGASAVVSALESYASKYEGMPRLHRLYRVACRGLPTKRNGVRRDAGSKRSRLGDGGGDSFPVGELFPSSTATSLESSLLSPIGGGSISLSRASSSSAPISFNGPPSTPSLLSSSQEGEEMSADEAEENNQSSSAEINKEYKCSNLFFESVGITSLQAARLALEYMRTTRRVGLLEKMQECASALLSSEKIAQGPEKESLRSELERSNGEWKSHATEEANAIRRKLRADLSSAKASMIKESIRVGHSDLGDFLLEQGDASAALKSFVSSRDYCTTTKHQLQMCTNVIRASLYLEHYGHIESYVSKAQSMMSRDEMSDDDSFVVDAQVRCARGLSSLHHRSYKSAACHFLAVPSNNTACSINELMSPKDVALYGTVCALASYSRKEVKAALSNAPFGEFLEMLPAARDALRSFVSRDFKTCLGILEDIKPRLKIDIYLCSHVAALYKKIRERALVQYVAPYLTVDLTKMASCFRCSCAALEKELVQLVHRDLIKARIDTSERTLHFYKSDERLKAHKRAVKVGETFSSEIGAMLVRMNIMRTREGRQVPEDNALGGGNTSARGNMNIVFDGVAPIPATPPNSFISSRMEM